MATVLKSLIVTALVTASMLGMRLASGQDTAAQANNPLATMKAFNMQNYYIGRFTETDEDGNQFWLRYAQPFSIADTNWLFRGSLPFNTFPAPTGGTQSGLGDLNLFAAYLIDTGNPAVSFGVGPQITAPTASDDALGSEKWSAGLVNVLFDGCSKKFQYGYLLSWQHSFAGPSSAPDANVAAFQPFAFYQLGGGWYTGGAPIWIYDLEDDDYSVPLGLRLGKVMKHGNTVYNVFVEPQYSVADRGPGWPEWQIFFALNLQFLGN